MLACYRYLFVFSGCHANMLACVNRLTCTGRLRVSLQSWIRRKQGWGESVSHLVNLQQDFHHCRCSLWFCFWVYGGLFWMNITDLLRKWCHSEWEGVTDFDSPSPLWRPPEEAFVCHRPQPVISWWLNWELGRLGLVFPSLPVMGWKSDNRERNQAVEGRGITPRPPRKQWDGVKKKEEKEPHEEERRNKLG